MGSFKPLIALNRDRKIGCTTADESPSASLIKLDSDSHCCRAPYLLHLLKQLGWRIRSKWRQFLIRRRRCNARLNYDPRSYAQNFDDGRRSPLAP